MAPEGRGTERITAPETLAAAPRRPTPTVTLGELYLAQGHRRDAAEIFEQILRTDPGDRRAREALEGLRRRGRGTPRSRGSSGPPRE